MGKKFYPACTNILYILGWEQTVFPKCSNLYEILWSLESGHTWRKTWSSFMSLTVITKQSSSLIYKLTWLDIQVYHKISDGAMGTGQSVLKGSWYTCPPAYNEISSSTHILRDCEMYKHGRYRKDNKKTLKCSEPKATVDRSFSWLKQTQGLSNSKEMVVDNTGENKNHFIYHLCETTGQSRTFKRFQSHLSVQET